VIGDTPAQLRARNIVLAEDDLWLHIPLNIGSTPKCAAVALTRMANTRGARPPCALAVITGTEFGYRRPDGVWAVLACGGRELVCHRRHHLFPNAGSSCLYSASAVPSEISLWRPTVVPAVPAVRPVWFDLCRPRTTLFGFRHGAAATRALVLGRAGPPHPAPSNTPVRAGPGRRCVCHQGLL
jgi:hypothetical protein